MSAGSPARPARRFSTRPEARAAMPRQGVPTICTLDERAAPDSKLARSQDGRRTTTALRMSGPSSGGTTMPHRSTAELGHLAFATEDDRGVRTRAREISSMASALDTARLCAAALRWRAYREQSRMSVTGRLSTNLMLFQLRSCDCSTSLPSRDRLQPGGTRSEAARARACCFEDDVPAMRVAEGPA